eukprot:m.101572 g.101572  ORF g.101572 m.101572 type:complete len:225 (+) comp22291_c0_seq3:511-1185(+)
MGACVRACVMCMVCLSLPNVPTNLVPSKMWLVVFPEGTRFTLQGLEKAQEFAQQQGWEKPSHVLLPRTKGVSKCIFHLSEYASSVYDVTIAYTQRGVASRPEAPSMWDLMTGRYGVHVHVARLQMPQEASEEELAAWVRERFRVKDELMTNFYAHGTFPRPLSQRKPSYFTAFGHLLLYTALICPFALTKMGRRLYCYSFLLFSVGGMLWMKSYQVVRDWSRAR